MKLSNKILVGFFGFGFIYLTAVFAEVRFRGTPRIIDDTNSIAETADISGITYLILRDIDKNISVIGTDQPRLEVRSLSGDLLQQVKYQTSGDTLTLWDLQSNKIKNVNITVFVPKASFQGITVNAAQANVKGLDQEYLHISQTAGRIWMSDNKISKIHIDASQRSYLGISATEVDTLLAMVDSSEVSVSAPLRVLQGSLKHTARLRISDVEEIQLKKDKQSKLNSY